MNTKIPNSRGENIIEQTILPFKLDITRDMITAQAGLVLFGEFALGVNLNHLCSRYLPRPGSGAGYFPFAYVFPLVLMLNGGRIVWRTFG